MYNVFYIEEIETKLEKIREKHNINYHPLEIKLFDGHGGYDSEYSEIYVVLCLPLPLKGYISWELDLIKEKYPNYYKTIYKLLLDVIKTPYNDIARENLLVLVRKLQKYEKDEKTRYVLKEIIENFLLAPAHKRIGALISHLFTESHEMGHALFQRRLNENYSKHPEFSEGFSDAYAYYIILDSIERGYLPSETLYILPKLRNQNDSLEVHMRGYKLFELDRIIREDRIKHLLTEGRNRNRRKASSILKKEVLSVMEKNVGNFRNQLISFNNKE
jgi:hypothetical protein